MNNNEPLLLNLNPTGWGTEVRVNINGHASVHNHISMVGKLWNNMRYILLSPNFGILLIHLVIDCISPNCSLKKWNCYYHSKILILHSKLSIFRRERHF